MDIHWLDPSNSNASFPDVEKALQNPDGLLAAGGDLSVTRLLNAYRKGIFPWYEDGQPILWWSPNPRGVLYTRKFRISSSLRKTLRKHEWTVTFDGDFKKTVTACAAPRSYARGTWITNEMTEAYTALHQLGRAHSVELWDCQERLVGGVYGVMIGKMFFGESMFSFQTNASKVALTYIVSHLYSWGCPLLDCQLPSSHLLSLGAEAISRRDYISTMTPLCDEKLTDFTWELDHSIDIANWKS
ncbi:MAG: leucyl/phenylalanyl-tRNA--protein transferase [Proteobacteria bacterium]|nr:leucyl/phenylalanyl-tRNA--protein transferase [Pseudomonadota bacterium]